MNAPPYSDETLVACVDGELDAAATDAIRAAAAQDPALARRIAQFEASRRILARNFAPTLDEPVPQRLLDAARGATKVVQLRRAAPRWTGWVPSALAASVALAIGIAIGQRQAAPQAVAVQVAGLPSDPLALARALETRASGTLETGTAGGERYEVLPTASFRNAQGGYCREFEASVEDSSGEQTANGVACRSADGRWIAQSIVAGNLSDAADPAAAGTYVPAGAASPDFAARLGAVTRLTPAQEAVLIGNGWRARGH